MHTYNPVTSMTSPESTPDIVFRGTDGTEAEEFIAAIEDLAFTEGWSEDDKRMLLFARSRLRHGALRWFAGLDPSKKKDWDLFLVALFEQYPPTQVRADVEISTPVWSTTTFSPSAPTAILPSGQDLGREPNMPASKAAVKPASPKGKADTVEELQVGDTLPDLTLKNEKDEDVKIAELAKEKGVVFFLVPKADTPGCTTQACGFRDNYEEFEKLGYAVYCLSADSTSAQSKWQTKKNLQYHLISDPKRELITALGAGAGGKTKRSHLVFEKGTGKLVEKKLNVKPTDSPTQALEFVKKHASA